MAEEDNIPIDEELLTEEQTDKIIIAENQADVEDLQFKTDRLLNLVGYDTEGAYRYMSVDGTKTKIYTKYLTGTTDADAETNIAHGVVDYDKIVGILGYAGFGASYGVSDFLSGNSGPDAFYFTYDANNINFKVVGANLQSQKYKIKIDYYL